MIDGARLRHIVLKLISYLRKEHWQIEADGMAKARADRLSSNNAAQARRAEQADGNNRQLLLPGLPDRYGLIPVDTFENPCRIYTLINSVAFHPSEPLFCATFTTAHKLGLFRVDALGKMTTVQVIKNPRAHLRGPQHAVFSNDGNHIIVANWNDATIVIYRRHESGMYASTPVARIDFPQAIRDCKPHGLEVSPSGQLVALALGASARRKKGIALFEFDSKRATLGLLDLVDEKDLPGIPKGITFSPDESHLVVSFSDVNCILVYALEGGREGGRKIGLPARQVLKGESTGLFRPEDVKVSRRGDLLIVSNSEANKVSLFPFDRLASRITHSVPCRVFEREHTRLIFPHGIAVSPDGFFVVISHFGPLKTTRDEDIDFGITTPRRQSGLSTFRLEAFS